MDLDIPEVRARIESLLQQHDRSARDVCVAVKLNTHFLSRLMSGGTASPSYANISKVAKELETTPEWILEGRGEKNPAPTALDGLEKEILQEIPEGDRDEVVQDIIDFGRYKVRQRRLKAAERKNPEFRGKKE